MIYMDHEYADLDDLAQAHLIAIEPDNRNVAMLRRNLEPYGDRVTIYPTGAWSHTTGLVVCQGQYRNRQE